MSTLAPLDGTIPPNDLSLLRRLGTKSASEGIKLWLVGGSVRDALMGVVPRDIDLVAESSSDKLAELLMVEPGDHIKNWSRFGTIKFNLSGRTVDFATARVESYSNPGALPVVQPSTITDDLGRRDISINAMAVSLAPSDFGKILDLHGGLYDLEHRTIRVLHKSSFQDDPTRILRVVRYATRFGFDLAQTTKSWLRRDRKHLASISKARIHRELMSILREPNGTSALMFAHRLGVMKSLHPGLGEANVYSTLRRIQNLPLTPSNLLGLLIYCVPTYSVADITEHLGLTRVQADFGRAVRTVRSQESDVLKNAETMSNVDKCVGELSIDALRISSIASPVKKVRDTMSAYIAGLRSSEPQLNGSDLLGLGFAEGPIIGQFLNELRGARLDGRVFSIEDEISYAERFLESM